MALLQTSPNHSDEHKKVANKTVHLFELHEELFFFNSLHYQVSFMATSYQSLMYNVDWVITVGMVPHYFCKLHAFRNVSHSNEFLLSCKQPINYWLNKKRLQTIKHLSKPSKLYPTYLYAKLSACLRVPMSWTIAKNCWRPSNFSCFSKTNMKWLPKQLCIITQSTAPGRFISVARNTISSPVDKVVGQKRKKLDFLNNEKRIDNSAEDVPWFDAISFCLLVNHMSDHSITSTVVLNDKLCQHAILHVVNASTQYTVNPPTVWPFDFIHRGFER